MGQIIRKGVEYCNGSGGSGSTVSYESEITEGTKVGTLTIDSVDNDIIVPPAGDPIVEITKAEYDELTPAEKEDKTFCITDWVPDESLGGNYNGPIGEIIAYMGNSAPNNFLICDGSIYNIADYLDLANHFNSQFGSFNYFGGDGTTTFAVPDLRGEFLRGSGENSHENSGNGEDVGVHQGGTIIPRIAQYNDSFYMCRDISKNTTNFGDVVDIDSNGDNSDYRIWGTATNARYGTIGSINSTTIAQYLLRTTRPTNTSVLYCIRYREAGTGSGSADTSGRIDGVLYLNKAPIRLTKSVTIYIDYDNGDNDNGLGTEASPFKTWGYVANLVPHDLAGYNLTLKISGTTFVSNKTLLDFSGFNNGVLFLTPINNPTFYIITVNRVNTFCINGKCTIDSSTNTNTWGACLFISHSNAKIESNITLIGSHTDSSTLGNYDAGIESANCANVIIHDASTVTVSNVVYMLKSSFGGNIVVRGHVNGTGIYAKAAAWCGRIAYTESYVTADVSCTETFSGGTISASSNW